MYICTWLTCLTHTAKMVLFTVLEHSDNTTALEKSSSAQEGCVGRGGFNLLTTSEMEGKFEKFRYEGIL